MRWSSFQKRLPHVVHSLGYLYRPGSYSMLILNIKADLYKSSSEFAWIRAAEMYVRGNFVRQTKWKEIIFPIRFTLFSWTGKAETNNWKRNDSQGRLALWQNWKRQIFQYYRSIFQGLVSCSKKYQYNKFLFGPQPKASITKQRQ